MLAPWVWRLIGEWCPLAIVKATVARFERRLGRRVSRHLSEVCLFGIT